MNSSRKHCFEGYFQKSYQLLAEFTFFLVKNVPKLSFEKNIMGHSSRKGPKLEFGTHRGPHITHIKPRPGPRTNLRESQIRIFASAFPDIELYFTYIKTSVFLDLYANIHDI